MDLIYEAYGAGLSNENRHPQIVMKELGITYKKSEGVAIRDAWFFYDCSNVPEKLPEFIEQVFDRKPSI